MAAIKMHQVVPWDLEVFLLLNLGAYLGLIVWSRMHAKSFRMFQLGCLLLLPALFAGLGHAWYFLAIWGVYVASAGYVTRLAFQRPVLETSPKTVYLYFTMMHQCCWAMFILGCIASLFRAFNVVHLPERMEFLAIYFGVVNRDLGAVAADRMRPASSIGEKASRARFVPANTCGICSQRLRDMEGGGGTSPNQSLSNGNGVAGKAGKGGPTIALNAEIVTLPCKHSFHGYCIRGWTIIGKRNICPVCGEKVDLGGFLKQKPWLVTSFLYSVLLGFARFVLVWNPLVFIFSGYGLLAIEKLMGRV